MWSYSARGRAARTPARAVVPALMCLWLMACGFTLRGTQQLPFATIALNIPPNSPLGTELARNIRTGTTTQIVSDPTKAAAVFDLLGENRDRQVLTLNAQGRAIEYSLRDKLRFRLRDAQGREVIEPTDLQVQRDISFNDSLCQPFYNSGLPHSWLPDQNWVVLGSP